MSEETLRQDPKWGTIEQKDAQGKIIHIEEGLIVGRGEKKRVILPDEVETLSGYGMTDREVSDYLGINEETLRYNFKDYILKGKTNLKRTLRMTQLKVALAGNVTMLIWLGKNILGQTDAPTHDDSTQPLPWTDDTAKVDE